MQITRGKELQYQVEKCSPLADPGRERNAVSGSEDSSIVEEYSGAALDAALRAAENDFEMDQAIFGGAEPVSLLERNEANHVLKQGDVADTSTIALPGGFTNTLKEISETKASHRPSLTAIGNQAMEENIRHRRAALNMSLPGRNHGLWEKGLSYRRQWWTGQYLLSHHYQIMMIFFLKN